MDKNSSLAAGIDIGTSTVRCVIGRVDEESNSSKPIIIGQGEAKAVGVRKGQVVDAGEVAKSIAEAVDVASQMAGAELGNATININGAHLISVNSQGTVAVNSGDGEIDVDELERVEESAKLVRMPENREIIQIFAQNYRVDGQATKNPVGMKGVRLEVDAHVVTASTQAINALNEAIDLSELRANNRLLSSVAASDLVLSREQKETGVAVIDFGASTVNVAVYEEQDLQFVSSIPVGSANITNDLAVGLQIDLSLAEELKVKQLSLEKGASAPATYKVGEQTIKAKDVKSIVGSRLDEIFELIDKDLDKIGMSRRLPGGIVLMGGGAKLSGIGDYAKRALGLPVHMGKVGKFEGIDDITKDIAWATAVSLMYQDSMLDVNSSLSKRSKVRTKKVSRGSKRDRKASAGPTVNLSAVTGVIKNILSRFKS